MDIQTFKNKVKDISKDINASRQLMLIRVHQQVKILEKQEFLLSDLDNFVAILLIFESKDVSVLELEKQLLNFQARASNIHDLVRGVE